MHDDGYSPYLLRNCAKFALSAGHLPQIAARSVTAKECVCSAAVLNATCRTCCGYCLAQWLSHRWQGCKVMVHGYARALGGNLWCSNSTRLVVVVVGSVQRGSKYRSYAKHPTDQLSSQVKCPCLHVSSCVPAVCYAAQHSHYTASLLGACALSMGFSGAIWAQYALALSALFLGAAYKVGYLRSGCGELVPLVAWRARSGSESIKGVASGRPGAACSRDGFAF